MSANDPRTDPTYKEWKLEKETYTAPHQASTDPTYKEWKLGAKDPRSNSVNTLARILPTRNGNCLHCVEVLGDRPCTDPTYKEWKPGIITTRMREIFSTDPTYKEWKLFCMG